VRGAKLLTILAENQILGIRWRRRGVRSPSLRAMRLESGKPVLAAMQNRPERFKPLFR
jgi:hypothetical protein